MHASMFFGSNINYQAHYRYYFTQEPTQIVDTYYADTMRIHTVLLYYVPRIRFLLRNKQDEYIII